MSRKINNNKLTPVLAPTIGMKPKDYNEYLKSYTAYVNYVQMRRNEAASVKQSPSKGPSGSKVKVETQSDSGVQAPESRDDAGPSNRKKKAPLSEEVRRQHKLAKNRRKREARRVRKAKKRLNHLALEIKETRLSKTLSSLKGKEKETSAKPLGVSAPAGGAQPVNPTVVKPPVGESTKKPKVKARGSKKPKDKSSSAFTQAPQVEGKLSSPMTTPGVSRSATPVQGYEGGVYLEKRTTTSQGETRFQEPRGYQPGPSSGLGRSHALLSDATVSLPPPVKGIKQGSDVYTFGGRRNLTFPVQVATLDRNLVDPGHLKTYYLEGKGDVIYCDAKYERQNFTKSGNGFVLKEYRPAGLEFEGLSPVFDVRFENRKYYLSHAHALEG